MSETSAHDVELREVTKRFGAFAAVRSVSLKARKGEFVTLLGPSGCGKTTTLRIIGGFEAPDEGEVLVAGRPVEATPPVDRRTRMVFQNYALFPHMTVSANVAFGLRMHRVRGEELRTRTTRMLDMMGLVDKASQYPRALSGGQQQRVALARALVTEPTVLLLDEPLGALDLKMRKRMQGELKKLQREVGITFIYVTHDQEEALALSDTVVVMDQGAIAQVGRPEEIYRNPRSAYVADFIGETNLLYGTVIETRDAEVTVNVRGHAVRARRVVGNRPDTGHTVRIAVRPEELVTRAERPDTANALHGIVVQRTFLGPSTRLLIETAEGLAVSADVHGPSALSQGEKVWVGWSAEDSLVLGA